MKRILLFSLFVNTLLLLGLGYGLQRLGGCRYALHRLRHPETGTYNHRKLLFEKLPVRPGAVVMLGDSQTALCEWHELTGDSVVVLNRGISGDYVDGIRARLDEVLRHKPAKIFLLIGINDLFWGQTPDAVAIRYQEIVQKIRHDVPGTQLILQSVLPLNNTTRSLPASNADVTELNNQIIRIAQAYALPYLDLYNLLTDADGNLSVQFSEDGIHLNEKGYAVWKQALANL
jgi:lysophospholipase L1-like esterase